MTKIALFVAHGSEDIETIAALDIFRRAQLEVNLISIEDTLNLVLARQTKIQADLLLSENDLSQYNVFYFPGGLGQHEGETAGANHFLSYRAESLKNYCQTHYLDQNQLFCAICAAPTIFYQWGMIGPDTKVTAFQGVQKGFEANYVDQPVVKWNNIFTSKGAGTTIQFALAIVETLTDSETVAKVKQGIQL